MRPTIAEINALNSTGDKDDTRIAQHLLTIRVERHIRHHRTARISQRQRRRDARRIHSHGF